MARHLIDPTRWSLPTGLGALPDRHGGGADIGFRISFLEFEDDDRGAVSSSGHRYSG